MDGWVSSLDPLIVFLVCPITMIFASVSIIIYLIRRKTQ
jgi:hypothetical protein